MPRQRTNCVTALLVGAFVVGTAAKASATEWGFRPLVEQSADLLGFIAGPSLNNAGDVVFVAEIPDDDGPGPDLGLFRTVGAGAGDATIERLALSEGFSPYREIGFADFPLISDAGDVAFRAVSFLDGVGVFTGPDPAADAIVDQLNDGVTLVGFFPAMNNAGEVLFNASYPGGVSGIYSGPDPIADRVVDNSGLFDSFGGQFDLNDVGDVVFEARLDSGVGGIYTGTNPATDVIVDSTGPFAPFFTSPRINDLGDLVFTADLDSGVTGIFTGPDPVADLLVDDTGPFEFLGGGFFNNAGELLFSALFDGGRVGIFDGVDPEADRVIATGDPLFGSTVTDFNAYDAYNDAGQLAIRYTLADGRQGIAIGAPIVAGDYNRDGSVDNLDYDLWADGFGSFVLEPGDGADGNGDGIIDAADYTVWRDATSSAAVAAPEPVAGLLAVSCGAILATSGCRRTRAMAASAVE